MDIYSLYLNNITDKYTEQADPELSYIDTGKLHRIIVSVVDDLGSGLLLDLLNKDQQVIFTAPDKFYLGKFDKTLGGMLQATFATLFEKDFRQAFGS